MKILDAIRPSKKVRKAFTVICCDPRPNGNVVVWPQQTRYSGERRLSTCWFKTRDEAIAFAWHCAYGEDLYLVPKETPPLGEYPDYKENSNFGDTVTFETCRWQVVELDYPEDVGFLTERVKDSRILHWLVGMWIGKKTPPYEANERSEI
jgi:hypothetical protein